MKAFRTAARAAVVLALVWGVVWVVRGFAASQKITADGLRAKIEAAGFHDWSSAELAPDPAEAKRREKEIRSIADIVNRLDFQEREKNRRNRAAEEFFAKLSPSEKSLFVELTVMESMNRFMEGLDAMSPEQRRRFVEQGLRDIEEGRTEEEMARANELGSDLIETISREGMRAYFEKSSTQTKLDLAPLMEAVNETMQGLRGNEFSLQPRDQ